MLWGKYVLAKLAKLCPNYSGLEPSDNSIQSLGLRVVKNDRDMSWTLSISYPPIPTLSFET